MAFVGEERVAAPMRVPLHPEAGFDYAEGGFSRKQPGEQSKLSQRKKFAVCCSTTFAFGAAGMIGLYIVGPLIKHAMVASEVTSHSHQATGKFMVPHARRFSVPPRPVPMNPSQLVPLVTPIRAVPSSATLGVNGDGNSELQSLQAEVVQWERMVEESKIDTQTQKMEARQQTEGVVAFDPPPIFSHTWLVSAFLAVVGMGGAVLRSISCGSGGNRDSAFARSRLGAVTMSAKDPPGQVMAEDSTASCFQTAGMELGSSLVTNSPRSCSAALVKKQSDDAPHQSAKENASCMLVFTPLCPPLIPISQSRSSPIIARIDAEEEATTLGVNGDGNSELQSQLEQLERMVEDMVEERKLEQLQAEVVQLERMVEERKKEEARRGKLMDLFLSPQEDSYILNQRSELLGKVDSHELLKRDDAAGIPSELLSANPEEQQMVFVDEFSCIGCKNCVEVSRSTFSLTDKGVARAFQQGAEDMSVIEEAIDTCPVDCIHWTSRSELTVLEEFRTQTFDDRWAVWETRRLVARAENGGGAPNWREPLEGGFVGDAKARGSWRRKNPADARLRELQVEAEADHELQTPADARNRVMTDAESRLIGTKELTMDDMRNLFDEELAP